MKEQPNRQTQSRRNYGRKERARLLEEFEQSGLTGAEFCRRHSIKETTFYYWRSDQRSQSASNQFVEVEVAPPMESAPLEVHLGGNARLGLANKAQVPLAVADAFKSGNIGIMDYYRMNNIQADTSMRDSIAKDDSSKDTD